MKVLVIEDDLLASQALITILSAHHYAVETTDNASDGLVLLNSFEYDLLILDVELPEINGIELCQQIRTHEQSPDAIRQIPILLLTGRASYHDRALGLDAGADDYMVKPFNEEELLARVRSVLRRSNSAASPSLNWGSLHLDPSACEVNYDGISLTLTPKEYSLLELFLRNSRRVFSCGNILEHLWTYEDTPGEEAVRTHIKGLRQKLKTVGAPSDFIETVYGIGYRLRPLTPPAENLTSPNPPANAQDLRSKLDNIWTEQKDYVSSQIAVIETVIEATQKRSIATQDSVFQQAIQQAHALAGTLGTFGFAEGSRIAREIETLLTTGLNPLTPKVFKQLQNLTSTLRQTTDLAAPHRQTVKIPVTTADDSDLLIILSQDQSLLDSIETEVRQGSFPVTIIATPQTVITLCNLHHPSIVLIDLECFEIRDAGIRLLESLHLQFPTIFLIVRTTVNTLAERLEIARHGGQLVIQKSSSMTPILEALHQIRNRITSTPTKILIVDEDITPCTDLPLLFKHWGLEVFTLAEPQHFWETLEAIDPDLLVLAIELLDPNGLELCQVVRSDLTWRHLPIVMMTARSDSNLVSQIFKTGANDWIHKPIVKAEVAARILPHLDRVTRQILQHDRASH